MSMENGIIAGRISANDTSIINLIGGTIDCKNIGYNPITLNDNSTLLIELLKQNMSEAERVKADKMLQMMQMLQKKKK